MFGELRQDVPAGDCMSRSDGPEAGERGLVFGAVAIRGRQWEGGKQTKNTGRACVPT